jgi:hypothetical protein
VPGGRPAPLETGGAEELHAKADTFARTLADGPTRAFAVVKDLARAYTRDGIVGADALLLDAARDVLESATQLPQQAGDR